MNFIRVLDDVYLLKTPFSTVWSGVVLIRGEKNFLIDSGAHAPEKYIEPALRSLGMSLSEVDWLLHTHAHGDHITAHREIVDRYGVKVACMDKQLANLVDPASNAIRIRTRFPEHSPEPQSWLQGVHPDKILREFETLEGRLTPIWTPGHDSDCVCWYDQKHKFIYTGDAIQGNGTPTQGIAFYQSLDDYLTTLRKLRMMDIHGMLFGHEYAGLGELVKGREQVVYMLDVCLEYVRTYHKTIKEMLSYGAYSPSDMATALINFCGCGKPEKLFLALYTVTEHLNRLKK